MIWALDAVAARLQHLVLEREIRLQHTDLPYEIIERHYGPSDIQRWVKHIGDIVHVRVHRLGMRHRLTLFFRKLGGACLWLVNFKLATGGAKGHPHLGGFVADRPSSNPC